MPASKRPAETRGKRKSLAKNARTRRKPNLLLLGATGSIANAVLLKLPKYRDMFGKLVLLSGTGDIRKSRTIDHKRLRYVPVRKMLNIPRRKKEFMDILKRYGIDIVLDLTTMDTMPVLRATDEFGASYINTSMNIENSASYPLVFKLFEKRGFENNAHIICTGMNPGVVDMWTRMGIEEHGVPDSVVFFEYDSSVIASGWRPMITWSRKAFIEEVSIERSAVMLGGDRVRLSKGNALMNRADLSGMMGRMMGVGRYPRGFVVPHEECASIAIAYGIPAQFIYAINQDTMDALVDIYKRKGKIEKDDLVLGDNIKHPLEGEDSIGVMLDYWDKQVYYFNSTRNRDQKGTNATCAQVAVGVLAALNTVAKRRLSHGIHFVFELHGTGYGRFVAETMKIRKHIFRKTLSGPSKGR
jgi:hypothetical protein